MKTPSAMRMINYKERLIGNIILIGLADMHRSRCIKNPIDGTLIITQSALKTINFKARLTGVPTLTKSPKEA